jgi:hypothetical protein
MLVSLEFLVAAPEPFLCINSLAGDQESECLSQLSRNLSFHFFLVKNLTRSSVMYVFV